jgi:hypothetical protein
MGKHKELKTLFKITLVSPTNEEGRGTVLG